MKKQICVIVVGALLLALSPAVFAEDGKTLYDSKCSLCHGKDGVAKSVAKGSRNFNDAEFQKSMTAEAIAKTAADGKNKMQPFKDKLTPEQLKLIADHVKTLGAAK